MHRDGERRVLSTTGPNGHINQRHASGSLRVLEEQRVAFTRVLEGLKGRQVGVVVQLWWEQAPSVRAINCGRLRTTTTHY